MRPSTRRQSTRSTASSRSWRRAGRESRRSHFELLSRGCPLFADDALTLSQTNREVVAHPGTPHMNIAQNLQGTIDQRALGRTIGIVGDEVWLAAYESTLRPRHVRLLCLLERRAGLQLELKTLPPKPLLLAPYMLGLSSDPDRQRSRFDLYADLMESATLVRLTAGLTHSPAQLADLIEQEHARRPDLRADLAQ